MYEGVFIFGEDTTKDKKNEISLPLEIWWKIFSYLDKPSLRVASHVSGIWKRMIMAKKNLKRRLNHFEFAERLGSEKLAKFYRKSRRKIKKLQRKNFLLKGVRIDESREHYGPKGKRRCDDLVVCTKRYKLF